MKEERVQIGPRDDARSFDDDDAHPFLDDDEDEGDDEEARRPEGRERAFAEAQFDRARQEFATAANALSRATLAIREVPEAQRSEGDWVPAACDDLSEQIAKLRVLVPSPAADVDAKPKAGPRVAKTKSK